MIQIEYIIKNKDGLHARPIAELANIAKRLGTQIFILKDDKIANVENTLDVICIGVRCGQKITIIINGYNEHNTYKAVKEYIEKSL